MASGTPIYSAPADAAITGKPRRIIVGISGASGAVYATRLVQLLLNAQIETHLVISPYGKRLLKDELGNSDLETEVVKTVADSTGKQDAAKLIKYSYQDVGAVIASGSFVCDGMIVIPCSSNTLGAIASGAGQNLMHRAAHVTLKERRKLVLVHREMPLSLIDINNMKTITQAGGIIAPANPGFYMNPKTLDDLVDFIAGKCLDIFNVEHNLNTRWTG